MTVKSIVINLVPQSLRKYVDMIEASPLGYRLARGAFWSLSGAVISRALALLASIIAARYLGQNDYGELGIIQSTVGMFAVFAGFGMGLTSTKHVAEFRKSDPAKTGYIIALSSVVAVITGVIMSLLLLIFAPWLAAKTLAAPHLSSLLRIGSGLLLLGAIAGAQTGVLAGFESFKAIAKVNFISGVISFPLMVGGVLMGGIVGAVWALIATIAVNVLANFVMIKKETRKAGIIINYFGCMREWQVLWSFSLPAVLSSAMVAPVSWICNAILVNQQYGYAEMGIFNAANQWFTALLFLPGIVSQTALPIMSERLGNNDTHSSGKLLYSAIKINAVILIPIFIVCSFLSPFIMQMYGEDFKSAWPTLIIILFTAGLLGIQMPVGHVIAASGRMWTGFIMNIGWGGAFILISWLLVNRGALGLASARAGAYIIHAIWTFAFAYYAIRGNRIESHA